jgi:biotin carboxylase
MKEKAVLAVIGAGEGAYPILKRALTLDYVTTLAFGQEGSLAKDYADIFVTADIFDTDFIVEKCKEYGVSGLIGTSESTTEITAILAEKLGLIGNDVTNGFGARNKSVMRDRVANVKSVKQPWFKTYDPGDEYDFPVIVKAPDSCGKRGISIARNEDDLRKAVAYSKEYSDCGDVLIEQYLEGGKEYSMECLAGNGLYEVIQYTEKDSSGPPHFVENGHHQPADLSDEVKIRIQTAVKDILKAVGINCGLAHLELKIINDELYFIEVGARGGGDHIADTLTVKSTDFDYFKAAIDCCLGRYVHQDVHHVAYTGIYFHCKANEHLAPIFEKAKTANWCLCNTVTQESFTEANSNVETSSSGYIIYCSDKKITLENF